MHVHILYPSCNNAFPAYVPRCFVSRLYFFLWTMFMVFTGMLFVMVGGFS